MPDKTPRTPAALERLLDALQGFMTRYLPSGWWEGQGLGMPPECSGSVESLGYALLDLLRQALATAHPELPIRQVLGDWLKGLSAERPRAELRRWRKPVLEWPCGTIAQGIPRALDGLREEQDAHVQRLNEQHQARLAREEKEEERRQQQYDDERAAALSAQPFRWKKHTYPFPPHQASLLNALVEEGNTLHEEYAAAAVWGHQLPKNWISNLRKLQFDTNKSLLLHTIPLEIRRGRGSKFLRLEPA
jgi:hypothetical protein